MHAVIPIKNASSSIPDNSPSILAKIVRQVNVHAPFIRLTGIGVNITEGCI